MTVRGDRTLTDADLKRIRSMRERRVRAAQQARVPIGWVSPEGEVMPGAPRLADPPKEQR